MSKVIAPAPAIAVEAVPEPAPWNRNRVPEDQGQRGPRSLQQKGRGHVLGAVHPVSPPDRRDDQARATAGLAGGHGARLTRSTSASGRVIHCEGGEGRYSGLSRSTEVPQREPHPPRLEPHPDGAVPRPGGVPGAPVGAGFGVILSSVRPGAPLPPYVARRAGRGWRPPAEVHDGEAARARPPGETRPAVGRGAEQVDGPPVFAAGGRSSCGWSDVTGVPRFSPPAGTAGRRAPPSPPRAASRSCP